MLQPFWAYVLLLPKLVNSSICFTVFISQHHKEFRNNKRSFRPCSFVLFISESFVPSHLTFCLVSWAIYFNKPQMQNFIIWNWEFKFLSIISTSPHRFFRKPQKYREYINLLNYILFLFVIRWTLVMCFKANDFVFVWPVLITARHCCLPSSVDWDFFCCGMWLPCPRGSGVARAGTTCWEASVYRENTEYRQKTGCDGPGCGVILFRVSNAWGGRAHLQLCSHPHSIHIIADWPQKCVSSLY